MFKKRTKHLIPLFILILVAVTLYIFDLHNQINVDLIKAKRQEIFLWIHEYPISSTLLFLAVYILSVSLVIPDSTILSLLAGMLYPFPIALILVCVSETVGALMFFMILRYAFSEHMLRQQIFSFHTIEKRYHQHPASYLLFFRFSHLLPFWLINALAVAFKTDRWTFIWTTFAGSFPLSFLLVQAGRSFGKALATNKPFSFHEIFNMPTKLSLIALGLIALIPVFVKKWPLFRK